VSSNNGVYAALSGFLFGEEEEDLEEEWLSEDGHAAQAELR
jgi:hypothetical protein